MIIGLGSDILEIARMEKGLELMGQALSNKILTEEEQEIFAQQKNIKSKAAFLASRFSVKEAAAKALGTGIGGKAKLKDFSCTRDNNGKPVLHLSDNISKLLKEYSLKKHFKAVQSVNAHVSISHTDKLVQAVVILEQIHGATNEFENSK